MARIRTPLIIALVSTALLLLVFMAITVVSFPLWFRYRNAPGLGAARNGAQIAAGLAALGLFVTGAIIAVAAALQPAGRWRKLLYVLPLYLLGFTLVGVVLYLLGIGTVGVFTTAWLAIGALLSGIAVVIAAARMRLGEQTAKRAMMAMAITGVPSLLVWLGVVASIVIVLTSQPSAAPGGPNGAPGRPGTQDQGGPGAARGSDQPRFQPGQPGPGEPFGPGESFGPGGQRASTTPLLIGGALMSVFAAIELLSITRGLRAARAAPVSAGAASGQAHADHRREVGQVAFSCIAITIVALAAAQLVPVKRDNPTIQSAVQWDSQQTQSLAQRACMDCHSNETRWPWYAYVAPGSWLLRDHVSSARAQFNLSELSNLPAFRAQRLPEDVAQQIRSGAMPPKDYLLLHPDARLTDAERAQLRQGMQQSLTTSLAR